MIVKTKTTTEEKQVKIRGFEVVENKYRKFTFNDIIMPLRGSKTSAGYDIYSNEDAIIKPGEKHVFWADVKAYMQDDEVLKIYVRSSIGIKKDMVLRNSVAVIEKDFYSNKSNYGNIGIALRNHSNGNHLLHSCNIDKDDSRLVQLWFAPYLQADGYNTTTKRIGGIGSTNVNNSNKIEGDVK